MAVVAPPPFKSNRDIWGSGNSTIYPAVSPAPMTDIMSYQYPPPPNGTDMDVPPSGYLPNYSAPPQGASGMAMRPSPDSGRDRSGSTSLKRSSISTPAGPPQSQSQTQQPPTPQELTTAEQNAVALATEKRRNKLGYHRTSVACGKYSLESLVANQFILGAEVSADTDCSRPLPPSED